MQDVTEGFEPRAALHFFEQLCAIPRGSGNEKAASDFVAGYARQKGFETVQDEVNNVYVRVPATKGNESAPPVLLQGHLDMVCAKRSNVEHDFMKDPLRLRVENGRLMATGTTLGADDGAAIAYMMALMETDASHPPLEMLMTVDEETGMTGAFAAHGDFFRARRLINLDSEPEGTVLVSCSGGLRVTVTRRGIRVPARGTELSLSVSGLRGGHSGQDIDKERGNANKLLGRILYAAQETRPFGLGNLSGGSKDNAIPIESCCKIACAAEDADVISAAVNSEADQIRAELATSDPGFEFEITKRPAEGEMFPQADTADIVRLLYLMPNGMVAKSTEIEGLVLCSSNLGTMKNEGNAVVFHNSLRSPFESMRNDLARRFEAVTGLCGAEFERGNEYPGWPGAKHSPLRELCVKTYRELYGAEMEQVAIHAGVECGILLGKLPGVDMISMGPTIVDYHTPEEWLDLASFRRTYEFLLEVLKKLCKAS